MFLFKILNGILTVSLGLKRNKDDNIQKNNYKQNYLFFRLQLVVETLGAQLNELTNQNSIKVLKC